MFVFIGMYVKGYLSASNPEAVSVVVHLRPLGFLSSLQAAEKILLG